MAKTVYKYQFEIRDEPTIRMPMGAKPLTFQAQHGMPTLWCIVDPEMETHERRFILRGTGHPLPEEEMDYIGSIQLDGFVWHLFDPEEWNAR